MSSATSTDPQSIGPQPQRADARDGEPLQPWQFFTLAGLVGATIVVFVSEGQSPGGIILLSLVIFAAAAVGVAAWRTFSPLSSRDEPAGPQMSGGRTRAALWREKTLVLRSIKDLEFDHAMGKVSDKDFTEMGARLRARATGLIRQLDEGMTYRQAIEAEIAKRIGAPDPSASPGSSRAQSRGPTTTVATTVAPQAAVATGVCSSCGKQNGPEARFCSSCGTKLAVAQ
jgi:hypothetical protein